MPSSSELDNELRQAIRSASGNGTLDYYILPNESDLDNIPSDPMNPLTPEKVELGKMLFHETGLAVEAMNESSIGTYSCGTCHIAEAGFKPGFYQGVADGGLGFGVFGDSRYRNSNEYSEGDLDVQSARPLTMINVAYVENTMWNGSFGGSGVNEGTEEQWNEEDGTYLNHLGMKGIETQNMEGVHIHRMNCDKELLEELGYLDLFDEVFADKIPSDRYTIETASLAMSAYIRTIMSTQAPFQKWLKGDNYAMNTSQKNGALLFFGKAQCYQCHYEPNLGSHEFHALGVKDMWERSSFNSRPTDKRNLGRGGFTGNVEDNYKFKVPGIYNSSDTKHYFHGASINNLEDLIEYKNIARSENANVTQDLISEKFNPLNLSNEEKRQLVEFLEIGLRDPNLKRYEPESVLSGNCIPNNDPISRQDLGCN